LAALLAGSGRARCQTPLESEIRAQVSRYAAALSRGEPRAIADLYRRGGPVSSAGDGEITVGWSEVLRLYQAFVQRFGRIAMEVDSLTVSPVGRDGAVAVFRYRWRGSGEPDSAGQRGAMTLVYERTPQGWRIVHDHTSSLPATAGPEARSPAASAGGRAADTHGGPASEQPSSLAGPQGPVELCVVARIVDGDTFTCRGGWRVRLIGVDAPELSQQPFGVQARGALARWVQPGDTVTLERDVQAEDRYGRRLAYVWRGAILVNWQLVRGGWALLLTIPPNVRYSEAFQEAQRRAREAGVGLWAAGGFACRPSDRRRGRCE
jgi:micrococcal nuclease